MSLRLWALKPSSAVSSHAVRRAWRDALQFTHQARAVAAQVLMTLGVLNGVSGLVAQELQAVFMVCSVE
jgi:hypothetical protein